MTPAFLPILPVLPIPTSRPPRPQSPRTRPLASATPSPSPAPSRRPPPAIRLLASDLDGTLLNAAKNIDPRNVAAVLAAIAHGVLFVPATGKSRTGALRAMGPLGTHLHNRHAGRFPGIFLNGLLVFGTHGQLLFEHKLATEHAKAILHVAEQKALTVLFYAADDILVRERTRETDMFIISHEPVPTPVGDLAAAIEHTDVHKALLVDPRGDVVAHRPALEKAFDGFADITQARPDVLEVLPIGASKGAAFVKLLHDLDVEREHAMAIGDGENDLEMIKAAGLGVAVANAVPEMLRVADEVVCGHDDAAVAEAIRRFMVLGN